LADSSASAIHVPQVGGAFVARDARAAIPLSDAFMTQQSGQSLEAGVGRTRSCD
jgi:hypothetical protein